MRSDWWKTYDAIYYNFERWFKANRMKRSQKRDMKGVQTDPEFYARYKDSILPYWARFGVKPGIWWAKETYLITGSTDPRYIPKDLYYRDIVPFFNDVQFMRPMTDKNLNSLLFSDVHRPKTVVKYISGQYCLEDFHRISREDAVARISTGQKYVIKPTQHSSSGRDIQFFSDLSPSELEDLFSSYENIDFIIQEEYTQHPVLASLNPTSVNTVRVVTLVYKTRAHILSSIVRVGGVNSRVDNVGAGGYQCTVGEDGRLGDLAYTHRNGTHAHVPENDAGIAFGSVVIPHYQDVCNTALTLAQRIPHLNLLAWDFSVNPDGEVFLIEYNAYYPGQNQENCGPSFGDLTEDILRDVYGRKKKR